MTKKEFTKRLLNIEHPVMDFGSDDSISLINDWCIIRDKKNRTNNFQAYHCRLSHKEYLNGDVDKYEQKAYKLQVKFEKWLYDICGNYCTVRKVS